MRELFLKLIYFRIFSMEFLDFEDGEDCVDLNKELIVILNHWLDEADKMRESSYQRLASRERTELYDKYLEWKVMLPSCKTGKSRYTYGVFKEFPYPRIDIEILDEVDEFEEKIDRWS